ncbi:MAG: hypothetical protein QHC79_09585 [Pseudosphingobacterium sp.]|nr:hypothetical protein [Pseudosphingobacterium sp.]
MSGSKKPKDSKEVEIAEVSTDGISPRIMCGIVMPIASMEKYPSEHWSDVFAIIKDVLEGIDIGGELVSYAEESGVIHKRIIQNLYTAPIVICDVSGRNPNVMFELGMRLAFDKATIVIKDDETPYSFDTAPIEHLTYPKDLRYGKINAFRLDLEKKVLATLEASKEKDYSTFLKHLGPFKAAKIEEQTVGIDEYIIDELRSLRTSISTLYQNNNNNNRAYTTEIIGRKHGNEIIPIDRVRRSMTNLLQGPLTKDGKVLNFKEIASNSKAKENIVNYLYKKYGESYSHDELYQILEDTIVRMS